MNKLAQIDFGNLEGKIGVTAFPDLGSLISGTPLILAYAFAGSLLLLYLIFGSFRYMLAQGDPKALQAAKAHITSALIGFVIVFTSYWIVQLVGIFLGLTQFNAIF